MAVINTNVKALFSQMALTNSGRSQSLAMQQLSTGKRINSARDDAAGMAIATRMTHQIRSLNQAVRNAGDAINLIQTAEGATNEITDMMQRMRELAVQAVNDTNDNAQRSYLDLEFQQLKQQIVQIADNTEWNGFPVLNGAAGERVGEMPVYKVSSNSLSAPVLINPTTARTVAGTGAGQQQSITFTSGAFVPVAVGSPPVEINVAGVSVSITSDETTFDAFMTKVQTTLSNNIQFDKSSGRSATIDPNTAGKLVLAYTASDGDMPQVNLNSSVNNTNALTALAVTAAVGVIDKPALMSTKEKFGTNGSFLQSGSLSMDINSPNSGDVTAKFLTSDGKTLLLSGTLSATDGTVTFTQTKDNNRLVLASDLTYTLQKTGDLSADLTDRKVSVTVDVPGGVPALKTGDLQINGVEIGPSSALDDPFSPLNNAAGSAIAKAAAINRRAVDSGVTVGEQQSLTLAGTPSPGTVIVAGVSVTLTALDNTPVLAAAKIADTLKKSPQFDVTTGRSISYAPGSTSIGIAYNVNEGDVATMQFEKGQTGIVGVVETTVQHFTATQGTGVFAKVNQNIMTGKAMDNSSVVTGTVFINGYASANLTSVLNNPRETRANVVRAINLISDKTGVRAVDTGSDTQGVSLVAADGRNIEVRFDTTSNAATFGDRVGLREGVQTGTYSLESKIEAPIILTSSSKGDISHAGMIQGNFTKNQSVYNTSPRPAVAAAKAQVERITVGGGTGLVTGDVFKITVRNLEFKATVDTGAGPKNPMEVRDALITQINLKKDALGVEASAGGALGEILLTSTAPGTPFNASADLSAQTGSTGTLVKDPIAPQVNVPAPIKALGMNDLTLNGIKIRPTTSADDTFSSSVPTSSDPSASAIAIANAINSQSTETGVRAQANPVISQGAVTTTKPEPAAGSYDLFINGTKVSVYLDPLDTEELRRKNVESAINHQMEGVTATDNGKGITLTSDGRNLSVWFDANVKGLSAASFGLDKGGPVEPQVSKITVSGNAADPVKFKLNGVVIQGDLSGTKAVDNLMAAFTAIASDPTNADWSKLQNLKLEASVDGKSITVTSTIAGTGFDLSGATVTPSTSTNAISMASIKPNTQGRNDVTAIRGANEKSTTASTMYGTVRLITDPALLPALPSPAGAPPTDKLAMLKATGKPFTISVGDDGFGADSNFSALGFEVGTFGGRSSESMDPPRVGRLAFQVGSSNNQVITIDLADFGKNGPITGEITGDVDLNIDNQVNRINTRDGASSILTKLDSVMDKINATRATMGAVMNRLDHVINNLTNVSMNLSASRSGIEDADYAASSTELAKTQIMQQAATAVLAQANTSQQTVLKLLGG